VKQSRGSFNKGGVAGQEAFVEKRDNSVRSAVGGRGYAGRRWGYEDRGTKRKAGREDRCSHWAMGESLWGQQGKRNYLLWTRSLARKRAKNMQLALKIRFRGNGEDGNNDVRLAWGGSEAGGGRKK